MGLQTSQGRNRTAPPLPQPPPHPPLTYIIFTSILTMRHAAIWCKFILIYPHASQLRIKTYATCARNENRCKKMAAVKLKKKMSEDHTRAKRFDGRSQ